MLTTLQEVALDVLRGAAFYTPDGDGADLVERVRQEGHVPTGTNAEKVKSK